MAKPCIVCGTPTFGTRCTAHRPTDNRDRRDNPLRQHATRWKRLSAKLRRQSPMCETCGTDEDLTVDHIVPVSEDRTLAFNKANLRVLCRSCNSIRGTRVTDAERAEVLARVGRRTDQGTNPSKSSPSPRGKAQQALHTLGRAS